MQSSSGIPFETGTSRTCTSFGACYHAHVSTQIHNVHRSVADGRMSLITSVSSFIYFGCEMNVTDKRFRHPTTIFDLTMRRSWADLTLFASPRFSHLFSLSLSSFLHLVFVGFVESKCQISSIHQSSIKSIYICICIYIYYTHNNVLQPNTSRVFACLRMMRFPLWFFAIATSTEWTFCGGREILRYSISGENNYTFILLSCFDIFAFLAVGWRFSPSLYAHTRMRIIFVLFCACRMSPCVKQSLGSHGQPIPLSFSHPPLSQRLSCPVPSVCVCSRTRLAAHSIDINLLCINAWPTWFFRVNCVFWSCPILKTIAAKVNCAPITINAWPVSLSFPHLL